MTALPPTSFDASAIAKALRTTFEGGRTRPLAWRKAQLAGLRRMMVEGEEAIVDALRADLGRPRTEAFASDIGHTKTELRIIEKHVASWMQPTKVRVPMTVAPARGLIQPEPLGVILVMAPWNYPIQLVVEPLAAALAAGNCVVAKPSELAPASSALLADLLPKYVDPEAVTVVDGSVEESTALLGERWDHIFFTGSVSVGRVVAEAAAQHLTPTTLELGGKSPTYVHVSANLEVAARRIAWGKFANAGQTCIAPDYVLADRTVRDELVERLRAEITRFYGDDPKTSPSFGRIVNERHVSRLQNLLDCGAGAVVIGGQIDARECFVAPTITVDPSPEAPVMQEEIFGPILPVLAVDGPGHAKFFITQRPKPLALYVFAERGSVVDEIVADTTSGGVCVNQTLMHLLPPNLPFGGVGESGFGAYHGKYGFDAFSHQKSILRKPTRPDLKVLYPPYTPLVEKVVRCVIR